MVDTLPVNALIRGLLVLEAVNTQGPAGLSQIWRSTGLPKATVFRLLESLRATGYLVYDEKAQTYQVGLRTLALSNNVSYERQLLQMSAPVMTGFRETLGWPSDLAVFQHDKMVIVDTNRQPGMLSANRSIGSRVPMMASATGRVYLASIGASEREKLLGELRLSTDPFEQLAKDISATDQLLDETASRGYALSDQEFLKTNRGAAVAVMHCDTVVCVINFIVIATVISLEEVEQRYVPMLLKAKAELEDLLQRFPLRKDNMLMVTRHSASGLTRSFVKK
ncbi:MAG: helix-turn-helix domain-containing protein [Burkholderiaceae bacterium]|nr:helix-turn-helix domain-containing protein [Burkholderiaceae bacterium]